MLILIIITSIVGCVSNPYKQYYTDKLGGKKVSDIREFEQNPGDPIIQNGTNPEEDFTKMIEDGYALIGFSSFNGKTANTEDAKYFAREIMATNVIVYSKYTNTVSGSIPWTVQNPSQIVTTQHQGSIYGSSGGSASYYGSSTTTAPGGSTTYNIPYSTDRYDQMAFFWTINKRRPICGVFVRDLRTEERQYIQRNRGAYVIAVIKYSPAYNADILKGDIIISIDNVEFSNYKELLQLTSSKAGEEVLVEIYRGGQIKNIQLKLNQKEANQ